MGRLREEYISTGKVRFVYKHFVILGPESSRAAEASECAAEQDLFWPYHDILFEDQQTPGRKWNDDRLTELAMRAGANAAIFRKCLESGRYAAQIRQESLTVQSLGMRGTPSFLINGVYVAGAQPYEAFKQIIEEQLARQGSGKNAP